jgi:hypothetical protein
VERGVLVNLIDGRRCPMEELRHTINDENFEQALVNLQEAGLLDREGEVVFATRAALRGDELSI